MSNVKEYMDHQALPKPKTVKMTNCRVAAFNEDRSVLIGLGNYQGEEFHNSAINGPEVCPCIHLDAGKVVYGCECNWYPVEDLPPEICEKFGIKVY